MKVVLWEFLYFTYCSTEYKINDSSKNNNVLVLFGKCSFEYIDCSGRMIYCTYSKCIVYISLQYKVNVLVNGCVCEFRPR